MSLMDDPTGDTVSLRRGGRLGCPDWALKTRLIRDTWVEVSIWSPWRMLYSPGSGARWNLESAW